MVPPTGQPPASTQPARQAVQVPKHLILAAARRIVSQAGDTEVAARRLISNASDHGIDFTHFFAILEPKSADKPETVRQTCLFVRGAGRTALAFISEPPRQGEIGTLEEATADRTVCLLTGCAHLKAALGDDICVAQALPDPRDQWATSALSAAGFHKVGDLEYLRRGWRESRGLQAPHIPPEVARVVPLSDIPEAGHIPLLTAALEQSYIETRDCPELCGMRTTADILDSHFATGEFIPELWWVLLKDGVPSGCMLFAPIAGQRAVELVYLGIAPQLRGKGLSAHLLSLGISAVRAHPLMQFGFEEFTCAVDVRNTAARKLYSNAGFSAFANRIAFVKTL